MADGSCCLHRYGRGMDPAAWSERRSGHGSAKLFSMIRKYRRYPGVDGIVLCLDVSVLLNSSVTERKSLADTLRLRILEVASTFQADIAVYLFLNNIDKLPGGETFLSLMNDELLAGGLGISMTHNEKGQNNFVADEERYRELLTRVSRYVLEILHDSPNMEMRHQLLLFTESLGALQNPCLAYSNKYFRRHRLAIPVVCGSSGLAVPKI